MWILIQSSLSADCLVLPSVFKWFDTTSYIGNTHKHTEYAASD